MISRLNVVDPCRMSRSASADVAAARINTAVAVDLIVSLENNFCTGVIVSSPQPLASAKGRTCKVGNTTQNYESQPRSIRNDGFALPKGAPSPVLCCDQSEPGMKAV